MAQKCSPPSSARCLLEAMAVVGRILGKAGGGRASYEDLGAVVPGLGEVFASQSVENSQHLYLVLFTSPTGRVQHVKVGKTDDISRRLGELKCALSATGKFTNWTVEVQRVEKQAGKYEEEVHSRLRQVRGAQCKGYPSFSNKNGQKHSTEVYNLPHQKVSLVVSQVMHDAFLAGESSQASRAQGSTDAAEGKEEEEGEAEKATVEYTADSLNVHVTRATEQEGPGLCGPTLPCL